MQLLSSSSTYFYKFVMPVMLALMAIGICITMLIEDNYNAPLVIFASVIFLSFAYWLFARVKYVSLDGTTLVISNFRREIRVPLSHLDKATGSLGVNPEVVWLYFRQSTSFGKKVLFVPTARSFPGFNHHPVVGMLNAMARTDKGKIG